MHLEDLYVIYDNLSKAGDAIAKHSDEYGDAIIAAQRGDEAEKKLAVQIIAKFFASFPEQQSDALTTLFVLCEDNAKNVRLAAIRHLPNVGKDEEHLIKISETMAQIMHVDDSSEQTLISNVYMQILQKSPLAAIKGVVNTIQNPYFEQIRLKNIQGMFGKLKKLDSLTVEVQNYVIHAVKDFLQDSIGDEFVTLMNYLVSSRLAKTFSGQKEICDIILAHLNIDDDFIAYSDGNNFANRLISFVKYLTPLLSVKVESTALVKYFCEKVLLKWKSIGELKNGLEYQLGIAQQLAIMSQFCGSLDAPVQQIGAVYETLLNYMPQPSEEELSNNMPDFNFSFVEPLLYAFYSLARQYPEYLTGDATLLKDFRSRLLYLSRGVNGCLKVINLSDGEKVFNAEEKRMREISAVLLKNISLLIKDLFYQPPSYKRKITLSFCKKVEQGEQKVAKTAEEAVAEVTSHPLKRTHVPITFDKNGATNSKLKRLSGDKKIYSPPSGKFSHHFQRGRGGFRGGRGRSRGGFRQST